jgi:hypothetical protein
MGLCRIPFAPCSLHPVSLSGRRQFPLFSRRRCVFAILLLLVLSAVPAARGQSATATALTITSGGSTVSTVPGETLVILTATVTAGNTAISPGQINFCDAAPPHCTDIHLLGVAQLSSAGKATIQFFPRSGTHTYVAVFPGTKTATPSSSSATPLLVGSFNPPELTIASGGTPGNYSLSVTMLASGAVTPPTGTISFLDTNNSNYVLGTAPLVVIVDPGTAVGGVSYVQKSFYIGAPYADLNSPSAAVADFNGDGKPDVAFSNPYQLPIPPPPIGATLPPLGGAVAAVVLGNGDGTFKAGPAIPIVGPGATTVATGDFNQDGKPDVIITQVQDAFTYGYVQLGNGDGSFTPGQFLQGFTGSQVTTGDFNGDGIADLLFSGAGNFTVMLGNGDGTFTARPAFAATSTALPVVADFNGDGKSDLVVSGATGTVTVLLSNGDGTFTPSPAGPSPTLGPAVALVTGDFNQDGILDLALLNNARAVTILLGNGKGAFTQIGQPIPTGLMPVSIATGDFNGDGIADLVVANSGDATVTIMLGKGDGTFGPILTPGANATPFPPSPSPSFATAGNFTEDGLTDIVAPGAFGINTLIPQPAGYSAIATVSGISVVGTGIHLVDASYPGDLNYAPSLSDTTPLESEPVPPTLTLTAKPTSLNQFQPIVLTANLTPNFAQNHNATGIVTFSSGATVLGTAAIANGVATLTTNRLPAGANSVIASYPGDTNFAPSASAPFAVAVTPVDFTMALASPSLTIQTQHHLTTSLTFTSINGFTDALAISCTSPPVYITCQFTPNPTTLAANGTITASFYLDTDSIVGFVPRKTAQAHIQQPSLTALALLLSPIGLFAGIAAFRKRSRALLLTLAIITLPMALALGGCGDIILPPPSTAPGTYTIPITATGNTTGLTHTAQLTLTITK